ncbi:SCO6745 family protein [Actinoplanes sp. CA-030573]|uniref:SCO6745 family protein n=1 Tax=Actinoplanes sp. CA-030573 TaxID=3239898 RepID=UPI003D8A5C66
MTTPRRLWSLFEPLHAVTYFTPQSAAAFEAAGLTGYWRRYFAGRAAPLGPVGPGPVTAAFFGFAPAMVSRAFPSVWSRISPAAASAAREAGAVAALSALLREPQSPEAAPPSSRADVLTSPADAPLSRADAPISPADAPISPADAPISPAGLPIAEAAEALGAAARLIDTPGRVLAAAYADLPWPNEPVARLWHAATLLREHRGDGHVAALLTAGVDGCESLVWRAAVDGGGLREVTQPARGWTDDEWQAAADRLERRGWLTADGRATDAGRAAYEQVEALTDRLAAGPWERLGAAGTERCAALLAPLAERAWTTLPDDNPIPLRRPARA